MSHSDRIIAAVADYRKAIAALNRALDNKRRADELVQEASDTRDIAKRAVETAVKDYVNAPAD